MTDAAIISRAIEASGQTARVFALYVLGRDKRTVERWRSGHPIPPAARAFLLMWLALTPRERDKIIFLFVPDDVRQSA